MTYTPWTLRLQASALSMSLPINEPAIDVLIPLQRLRTMGKKLGLVGAAMLYSNRRQNA